MPAGRVVLRGLVGLSVAAMVAAGWAPVSAQPSGCAPGVAGAPGSPCLPIDQSKYLSGCGSLSFPSEVRGGDWVTATATVSVGGLCGDAPAVTVSGASAAGALVDGVSAATGPYRGSYPGLGPPYTVADDGPTFMLPPQSGSHTLTFRMKRSRTDRCVTAGPNDTGVGPWALVTGNGGTVGWSSNYPFRIIGGPTLQYQVADASWTAPPQPVLLRQEVEYRGRGWRSTGRDVRVYLDRRLIRTFSAGDDVEGTVRVRSLQAPECTGVLRAKQGSTSVDEVIQGVPDGVGGCAA